MVLAQRMRKVLISTRLVVCMWPRAKSPQNDTSAKICAAESKENIKKIKAATTIIIGSGAIYVFKTKS